MRIQIPVFLLALTLLATSGCVTQKKYDQLLAEKVKMEVENTNLEDENERLEEKLANLRDRYQALKEDSVATSRDVASLEEEYADLKAEYNKLDTYYNNLLSNSGKLSRDLEEQRTSLMAMRAELEEEELRAAELEKDLQAREVRVQELEQILADKDSAVNALKNVVSNALLSFKDNDLTVEVKNGKVYVSLPEKLLFGSGSVSLDRTGVDAISKIGKVLSENTEINVMVEGHTDNVPISRTSQYMKDNWDLSVMRATSIVRILITSGVSPERIIASGRGEYAPLAVNDTPENKAINRRTEIILTPRLDELFRLLEAN